MVETITKNMVSFTFVYLNMVYFHMNVRNIYFLLISPRALVALHSRQNQIHVGSFIFLWQNKNPTNVIMYWGMQPITGQTIIEPISKLIVSAHLYTVILSVISWYLIIGQHTYNTGCFVVVRLLLYESAHHDVNNFNYYWTSVITVNEWVVEQNARNRFYFLLNVVVRCNI